MDRVGGAMQRAHAGIGEMAETVRLKCDACGLVFRSRTGQTAEGAPCPRCKGTLRPLDRAAFDLKLEGEKSVAPTALIDGLKDRYRIVDEIGRGGMGVVYKAEQVGLNRAVAIKTLRAGENATDDMIERFIREARAAGSLRHPNIVAVHDAGEVAGIRYFVMDFIEGESLHSIMKRGDIDVLESLKLIAKIARALCIAHARGIVHRDLKPANIILDPSREPHITDFGLAKDMSVEAGLSMSGTIIGTPDYMSPEGASGLNRQIDKRSDIYSLGVILYELLTHTKPFKGQTVYETINNVVKVSPPPPRKFNPNLGPDLDAICMKALEKDKTRRYQDMAELSDDIERYLRGEQIMARVPGFFEMIRRRLIGKGAIVALILIAMLLSAGLAGGVGYVLLTRKGHMQVMAERLQDDQAGVRRNALDMLIEELSAGRIKDDAERERVARLIGGVAADDPEAELRLRAIQAIGRLRLKPAVGDLASAVEKDPELSARKAAIEALKAIRTPEAVEALRKAARNGMDPAVQLDALKAYVELAGVDSLSTLLYVAGRPAMNPAVRSYAKDALQEMAGKDRKIIDLWNVDINIGNAADRARFVTQMAADRQQEALDDLAPELEGAPKKKPAPKPTAKPRGPEVLAAEKAVAMLASENAEERLKAAYSLGVLKDKSAAESLKKALCDPDPTVCGAAAESLVSLESIPADGELRALLRHANPGTRAAAAVLIRSGGRKALASDALVQLGEETDNDARAAMIECLGGLKSREAAPYLKDRAANAPADWERRLAQSALAQIEGR